MEWLEIRAALKKFKSLFEESGAMFSWGFVI
jgi:hypothetical protein